MLNISPFSYGLIIKMVYDSGTIFAPQILDIRPEDLRVKFLEGECESCCSSSSRFTK
ncbi:60S acidic ribosomal protein P0-like [Diaphorina citri]|uniref:60S acidic ribosomal protein P0-like n=1 Tax=Diaphorina citri TaxID=121845 RepID=A0A3Q0IK83_DIACI|nr:60S acidic ribosomal protein P0-like [Diaphorina citri]